ncbi:MAG TPA: TatD family hydrolase, partial [Pseudoxanthomonas sp.]|nr:TatD family hydrolase [Pseudoxanthomonas sp.]
MLVDSHCHLDVPEFDADREAVVLRACAAGVLQQVVPAIDAAHWPPLRDICKAQSGLFPAYGLHPMFLDRHRPEHLLQLGEWITREQPVAVGECGLDFFVEGLDAETQQSCFDGQLALARDFDLPVIVHARRAVDAVITSLRRVGNLRGVVHSFSGSPEQARQLWQLGFLIGIGGPVTHERAKRLRGLVTGMPLE